MKQMDVQIMGQSYLLGCPEGGEARLQEAVLRVDTAMCKIREAGKVRARDRIAVLAALNMAFDLIDRPGLAPELGVAANDHSAAASQTAADSALAQSLIARLDSALGEDGQLL